MKRITILINCNDKEGIIANTTNFIHNNNGNIVYIDQYVDRENGIFFMRLESEFKKDTFFLSNFKEQFKKSIAIPFNMSWEVYEAGKKTRVALFVSKYDHCLYDILGRYNSGELNAEIPFIISNHPDLKPIADSFKIDFHHIPVHKDNKKEAEARQLDLLKKENIELIVLARYMQIVSGNIIAHYPTSIINIHHSFLPAFVGAKPYHSAYKRGVKIIGATSHYVTEELDAGPIIEQDVTRVSHSHSINDLVMKGRDLEKIVLSTALKLHLERKTMVYNNKTVIFT
ncbi:formyltetrahydrofolate deformylase [Abyssalbus ytuae]|uniref:Formyltetrahydrofolate deformylase n=1 Tax=Abyssalbus ytuae TaxID=2926907 RepID=A0A9E6ZU64_9FLAO|nr:formyltetrahydrofolate deformylase [Abyssalbus ytuae]UOB16771.1 formyltetrahydrofolate deformylase [Abyssalbus ytuae]